MSTADAGDILGFTSTSASEVSAQINTSETTIINQTLTTPANQATTFELVDRGSGGTATDLVQELVKQAQDDIKNWAASMSLIATPGANNTGEGDINNAGEGTTDKISDKPLAFEAEALGVNASLGNGLMEALILGGGSLYAFNRFSGGKITRWISQLLPKAPGGYAGARRYERVVVVFLMQADTRLQRLVAAQVDDDKLEVLAEQVLPMSLKAAAASPGQLDLDRTFKQLVKKVSDQSNSHHDLLLFDPKIQQDLPIYKSLGKDNDQLQPQSLRSVLATLNDSDLEDLRRWINRPSSVNLKDHPISNRLAQRQQQLRQQLNDDKARLVSLLELSLAMAHAIA